jgi:TatD DNase family protein
MLSMFIDTHAHVSDKRFDADRADSIGRARENNVSHIIEIGCEPGIWNKTLKLAEDYPGVSCAVGIHPQEAKLCTDEILRELAKMSAHPNVCAIGETGFDYHYENSPRDKQKEIFIKHIALSREVRKPLVIHCRDAYPDLLAILNAESDNGEKLRGVIHCFSGSLDEARQLIALGFLLGIDGPVTYPKATALKEVVKELPLDRFLLETDSPYLPPQTYRGERNEPSYLPLIAQEIALLKQVSLETVAAGTTENAKNLFGI